VSEDCVVATEIFQSTVNEGKLYHSRLRAAFKDRFDAHNALECHSGAVTWASLAGIAIRTYEKQFAPDGLTVSVRERLLLALMLSDYYALHIAEFTPEERIETAKRLGLPGLDTRG
jgi:hypothetical protein